MTVYAITDTEKGRTGIAPTYLQTTRLLLSAASKLSFLYYLLTYLLLYSTRTTTTERLTELARVVTLSIMKSFLAGLD